MLRLKVGSLILVRNRPVEIVGRRVLTNRDRIKIVHDCCGADGDAQLVVTSHPESGACLLSWIDGGPPQSVDEFDIAIYR